MGWGFYAARRRWRRSEQAGRAARTALAAAAYTREVLDGLKPGWINRIAAELGVSRTSVSRYIQDIRREAEAALAAAKPCPVCGCTCRTSAPSSML